MTYDLKPVSAPRAAGSFLRLFTRAAEGSLTKHAVSSLMLASAGIPGFRETTATEPHPVRPMWPETPSSDKQPTNGLVDQAAHVASAEEQSPFESAADFVRAYEEGSKSPVEVAEKVVEATAASDRLDPPMRVFIAQDAKDILSQAKASAERYAQGKPLGPLDGVPIAVKDEIDQQPYPTTVGTKFLGLGPATEDGHPVARLRAQGALLIGKANMQEIGIGVTGLNPHHGAARNPYDPARATGGSSSGSAAAVAAGFCPIALGADGGGSIRIPAGLCGQLGLKPTHGRVSEHGAAPLCWSVAHVGPIASSVRDLALAYAAICGRDSKDPNSWHQPEPVLDTEPQASIVGLKLGIYTPWFEDATRPVVAACRDLVTKLEQRGAQIVEITIPELALIRPVHLVTIISEMAASQLPYYDQHRSDYGHETRMNLSLARTLQAHDYVHAQRLRSRICAHFAEASQKADVILTPTTACTTPILAPDALETGESNLEQTEQLMRFAQAANLTGQPAMSIPAGYDALGLPIGLQLIGRPWEEHVLFRVAQAAETLVPRQRPMVRYQLL